jgi:hypothetical protein
MVSPLPLQHANTVCYVGDFSFLPDHKVSNSIPQTNPEHSSFRSLRLPWDLDEPGERILEWRPRIGRPQAKWCNDLLKTAGKSWMRVAEDRARWREVGGLYPAVDCSGLMMIPLRLYSRFSSCCVCWQLFLRPAACLTSTLLETEILFCLKWVSWGNI